MVSTALVPAFDTTLDPSPLHEARGHARAGIAALVGFFLWTYLLLASPLQRTLPAGGLFVPAVVGIGFLTVGRLFALIVGTRPAAVRVMRVSALATLALGVALCIVLRAKWLWRYGVEAPGDARTLPAALLNAAARILTQPQTAAQRWVELIGMVLTEEAIKLLPVFVLIRARLLRNASEAMLAAAVGGLCFGMVEAINHSFFLYARTASPATTYLVRAFVMAPSHGIGAAVACGVAFALAATRKRVGGRPSWGDLWFGFMIAAALHAAHNGLQTIGGPASQIVTVFVPVALWYALVRATRESRPMPMAGSSYSGGPWIPAVKSRIP